MIIIEIRAFRAHLRRFKGQKRRRCNERDESRVEKRGEGQDEGWDVADTSFQRSVSNRPSL